jgi:hypothetical protein
VLKPSLSLGSLVKSIINYFDFPFYGGLISALEFCSVSDDSCLILWDIRSGNAPVVKVSLWLFLACINFKS